MAPPNDSQTTERGHTPEPTTSKPRQSKPSHQQRQHTPERKTKSLCERSTIPHDQITYVPFPWTRHPTTGAALSFFDFQRSRNLRIWIGRTESRTLPAHLNPETYRDLSVTKEQYAEEKKDAILCICCGQKYWGTAWWKRYRTHLKTHGIMVPTRANKNEYIGYRSRPQNARSIPNTTKCDGTKNGKKITHKPTWLPPAQSTKLIQRTSESLDQANAESTSVPPSSQPSPTDSGVDIQDRPSPDVPRFIEEAEALGQPAYDSNQNMETPYDADSPLPNTTGYTSQFVEDLPPRPMLATTQNFIRPSILNASVTGVSTVPSPFPQPFSMSSASSPYVAQTPQIQRDPEFCPAFSTFHPFPFPVDDNFSFTFPGPSSIHTPFIDGSLFPPGQPMGLTSTAISTDHIVESSSNPTLTPYSVDLYHICQEGEPSNRVYGDATDLTFDFDEQTRINKRIMF